MMAIIKIFVCLVIAILQISVFAYFEILGGYFNIIVVGLVLFSIFALDEWALFLVLIGGAILDLFSTVRFGLNLIFLLIIYYAIKWFSRKYFSSKELVPSVGLIMLATSLFEIPHIILVGVWPGIISILLSGSLAIIIYLIIRNLLGKKYIFNDL